MESNLGPPGKLLSHVEFSTDSAGAATFETLPLTPPRKAGNRSADVPLPTSPFAQSQPQRTFRSLSGSSYSTPTFLSSPLKPPAASAEFRLPGGPNGRPLPIPAIPSKPIRSPYPQTSPFSSASARAGAAFASWPSFTREPPVLQNAPQARADGRSLEPSLTRLLSMERGEEAEADSGEDEALGLAGKRVDVKKRWQRAGRRARMLVAMSPILRSGLRPAKKLFLLILLNFLYSAIEFLIGLFSGRIGLVSDSFHLTFGCGVLTFSLYALVGSQKKPDETFTYGYKRLEVLAAFTNALFLFFLSFSLAVEALHAFIQDESEHKHYLIVSAVTNLLVNLLGVWFFRQYARIRVAYRKAEDMNLHAVCLHVLADSIRSAGVILASWLLALGVTNAETLCFLLVSVSVVFMAMPIFKASGGVLLQMSPTAISTSAFSKCLRQVLMHEGVSECSITRFWDMVPGFVVGTMILRVKEGADEQKILRHVHSVYNDLGVSELTVQLNIDR